MTVSDERDRPPQTSRVGDERLAEMLAGLDGVTPGPWTMYGEPEVGLPPEPFSGSIGKGDMEPVCRWGPNLHHIARCDPDTMRSILTELQSLRSLSSDSVSEASKGVRVKLLEWSGIIPGRIFADIYMIERLYMDDWRLFLRANEHGDRPKFLAGPFSLDEAKAAAEADYRQRILYALDSGTGGQAVCNSYADENQRLFDRAEAAEQQVQKLRDGHEAIARLVTENLHDNGADIDRMKVDGEWHSGPVVDAAFRIIRGLLEISRAALNGADHE